MEPSESQPVDTSQYNAIVDVYSKLYPPDGQPSPFVPSELENAQLWTTLTDPTIDIRNKHVLDLACGQGYHTTQLLTYGAASVIGVDISSGMLETARANAQTRGIPESKLKYVPGDATDTTTTIEGAPFDIVTSCWLLNYAPDATTMTKMWTNIGRHLKPGGVFVGLTIQPLLTDRPFEGEMLDHAFSERGAWGKYGTGGKVLHAMPNGDGYKTRMELSVPGKVDVYGVTAFECYYLRNDIFESSCRESGLFNGLEWRDFVVPEAAKKGQPVGFWNDLALWPHCRACVARRPEQICHQ